MQKHFLILSLTIVTIVGCGKKKQDTSKTQANAPQATVVDVLLAGVKTIDNNIEANGSVIANEMLQINPEVSGRLTYLNVPDGGFVNEGTLLAKINDADLQAQLNKSKTQLDLAQKTEERLKKLLAVNGINQADYDLSLNTVNNIKADIELLKAQIDKTIIKAPFSGVLGLRMVSPGAFVTPQTILATLQQTNKVKIDFTLPEIYANNIRKGQTVQVLATNSATRYTATVIAIEPQIIESSRNIKIRAVPNSNALTAGSFVKVLVNAGSNNSNIVIPTNAIIPDARAKRVVIVKDGKGKFVDVETGTRTANGIAITKGLSVGDSVVVTGVLFVRPNASLKVRSIKKLDELVKEQ